MLPSRSTKGEVGSNATFQRYRHAFGNCLEGLLLPRERERSLGSSGAADSGQAPFPTGSESSIIGCEERSFVAMLLPSRLRASRIEILCGIAPLSEMLGAHVNSSAPPPCIFVSVASKGLRVYVSGLESTHAGISISVDSK
jgi:hypothetical protein